MNRLVDYVSRLDNVIAARNRIRRLRLGKRLALLLDILHWHTRELAQTNLGDLFNRTSHSEVFLPAWDLLQAPEHCELPTQTRSELVAPSRQTSRQ